MDDTRSTSARDAGLTRRHVLRLGVTAAATLASPARPVAAEGPVDAVDHPRAAQQAYRDSLRRLRRSVPGPDGRETWETGSGT